MKVSVIIPAWQCDDTIGECLKSVRGSIARYDGDIEFETLVVASRGSEAVSRNEGLGLATGDYIAWIDADDEVAPDWAAEIASAINNSPDIIAFDVRATWWDGRKDYVMSCRPRNNADFLSDVAGGILPGQVWCKVMRRNLFDGLSFSGRMHCDYRIQCEMARNSLTAGFQSGVAELKISHIPKPLYIYHRREFGLSQYHNVERTAEILGELAELSREMPPPLGKIMAQGVAIRIADFLRNAPRRASSAVSLRKFLRAALHGIVRNPAIDLRTKAKTIIAGAGL